MDDPGQGVFGGDGGKDGCEGAAVGHVTGRDVHLRAEAGQVVTEFAGTGGVGPAPAGEDEVAHTVCGDQVPCEQTAEYSDTAGDQHRAVRVQGLW